MNVNFNNKTFSFSVAPGADGYRQFARAIRGAFQLPRNSELNITFTCDEPCSGSLLTLSGAAAYDAAVHCAAVAAVRRSCDGRAGDAACDGHGSAASGSGASTPSASRGHSSGSDDGVAPSRPHGGGGSSNSGSVSSGGRWPTDVGGEVGQAQARRSFVARLRSALSLLLPAK